MLAFYSSKSHLAQVKKAVVHTQELNLQLFFKREMLYQERVCKLPQLGREVFFYYMKDTPRKYEKLWTFSRHESM